VAVASAGPYASLYLAPDRQPHQHSTTLFFTDWMPFLSPNHSAKALKARLSYSYSTNKRNESNSAFSQKKSLDFNRDLNQRLISAQCKSASPVKTGGFCLCKINCPHALADSNQRSRIREKTLQFSSAVLYYVPKDI